MGENKSNKTNSSDKASAKRVLGNNLYMIKLTYQACPWRVIGLYIKDWLYYGVLKMFGSIIFLERLVTYIETGASFETVVRFLIFAGIFVCACYLFINYYAYILGPAGNQVMYEHLHLKMFAKATDVELECFENPEFYNKYTKATAQIKGKAFAAMSTTSSIITNTFNQIFLTVTSLVTDPLVLLFTIPQLISTYMLGVKANKLQYQRYEDSVEANRKKEYVKRTVYWKDYAKEIRLSNIFNVMMDYLDDSVSEVIVNIKKYGLKLTFLSALQSSLSFSLTTGCTIVYAALRLLYWKNITAADFVVLVNVIMGFSWNIESVARDITKLQDHSQYIENIRAFMDYEPKIAQSQDGLVPQRHALSLRMKDVSYTYFGQENPVLKHINLEIHPKEKIALVGHNGAGKSTLVKLLMRLYDVSEGEITLGEHNIKEYRVRDYRDLFGTVFQDYKVLSMSVAENVRMDDVPEDERENVKQALINSGVYDKIETLEHGMDTILGREFDKEGVILSGGETQKVAIARVFAKDSDFVILDEPSSALDPIAEYKMYDTMLKACENKAVIFISHRLSSAVLADRIYMLEQGEVVESGTHEELLQLDGKYAQMFKLQAESYQ